MPRRLSFDVVGGSARIYVQSMAEYRQVMADRFAVWTEITGATSIAAA